MTKIIKRNIILVFIILIAFFFYIFRLKETFILATDTARDLVRVMEIWQTKEITAIGPPLNTINNKPMEVYFGSMHYYFGIIGLLFSKFDPIGSVYVNIILCLISIPFFYALAESIFKEKHLAIVSTILYALSPVTLSFVRSYWNPNLIVPLSVFVWYCFLYKKSFKKYFVAGILSGIILNLHYMDIAPILFFLILMFFDKKDRKYATAFIPGFILSLTPLIAFEIRNNFFLTKAFFSNLGGFSTFSKRSLNPLLSIDSFSYIFGLGPEDFYLPSLINPNYQTRIIVDTILGIPLIYFLFKRQKVLNNRVLITLIFGLVMGWYLETWHIIHLRYIFSLYPILIITSIIFLSHIAKIIPFLFLIPTLVLSLNIINYKLDSNKDYYPLSKIEEISQAIVLDNPQGKYNITENILGDARSLSFRYYLMRDAQIKPQSQIEYSEIDALYVVSPSVERIYQQNRWEFDVSKAKKLVWQKDFGELKLFKFTR